MNTTTNPTTIQINALRIDCPFCKASVGTPCGTLRHNGQLIICNVRKETR